MESVTVNAPATVSNVVCGFDCLGFALSEPFDQIIIQRIDERVIRIVNNDKFELPTDPSANVMGVAVRSMLDTAEAGFGVEIISTKTIKPGSGIGSSSASSCAAVFGVNTLLGSPFGKRELVEFAMDGEKLASGSRHADNVAPCIYGGFVLVRSIDPLDIVELQYPELWVTVIHPQVEIKTSEARALLPEYVPLTDAVKNWSNLGAFVAGLSSGDFELIGRSMKDYIVEPARESLIPHFRSAINTGREMGAIGGGISGSGPSIFFLSIDKETSKTIEGAVSAIYKATEMPFQSYVSKVDPAGVRLKIAG